MAIRDSTRVDVLAEGRGRRPRPPRGAAPASNLPLRRARARLACGCLAATVISLIAVLTSCNPSPPSPPGAPTALSKPPSPTASPGGALPNVTAQASDTVIKLSWQAVPGAAGYSVFRDAGPKPLHASPLTEPACEDIGLTNGRSYRYVAAVIDTAGQTVARSAEIVVSPSRASTRCG